MRETKMTKSEMFTAAWIIARNAANRFGGSSKSYFAEALKMMFANTGKLVCTVEKTNSCYYCVYITNAIKHAEVFGQWRSSEMPDGSLMLLQVRWAEIRRVEQLIEALNTPAKPRQPKKSSGRYVELLAVAQRDGLNHGRSWYLNSDTCAVYGFNPMHEGELVCYVYQD
ncbi:hypothetical protein YG56_20960 [Salmonella enterica subsp. enterica serovar Kentucky]|nr:hypothetical protein [Salmonella enterica subsp. enterica serovar Kentucky]